MTEYCGAVLLITGGTGSFGSAVLKSFLKTDIGEIRIFSRDEKKQDDMRHMLQAKYPAYASKVHFFIGDVRDQQSLSEAVQGTDFIFHAAALKQVPSCEVFPMEAVKTNVVGTDNVLRAAAEARVRRIVCLSTDKAAYPINAMGISKAMMEHVIAAHARTCAERGGPVICCTRYGNVMCSRGSVIPLFIGQIRSGHPVTVTDPRMTRFLMSLDEAVDLVRFAFQHAKPGDLFVQKADASTVGDLARGVQRLFGDTGMVIIGSRPGEKLYETLLTREERVRAEDMGPYFRVRADLNTKPFRTQEKAAEKIDYLYKDTLLFRDGGTKTAVQVPGTDTGESYTSHHTQLLSVDGVVRKILTTEYVRDALAQAGLPQEDKGGKSFPMDLPREVL